MKHPPAWSQLSSITGNFLRPGGLLATNEALAYCQFNKEALVLDVGCGLGGTIEHLQALGFHCIGLDVSQELLMQQATRLAATKDIGNKSTGIGVDVGIGFGEGKQTESTKGARPLLVQGDSSNLPLQNASLQGIFCECVLSLLEKPAESIQEFYRVLQNGGKLIITDIIRKEYGHTLEKTELSVCAESSLLDSSVYLKSHRKVGNVGDVEQLEQSYFPCLDGALPLTKLRVFLLDAGFTLHIESDYSRSLAELSALLILHDMKFEDVFFSQKKACDCTQGSTFGYVLLIAEKGFATVF